MKKLFLSLGVVAIVSLCAIAAEDVIYTNLFISRFLKCIPCSMQQTVTSGDNTINISRRIGGWHEHKCTYTESTSSSSGSSSATCNFSREQINELVSVMRSDPTGTSSAKTTWEKYQKDASVCSQN